MNLIRANETATYDTRHFFRAPVVQSGEIEVGTGIAPVSIHDTRWAKRGSKTSIHREIFRRSRIRTAVYKMHREAEVELTQARYLRRFGRYRLVHQLVCHRR